MLAEDAEFCTQLILLGMMQAMESRLAIAYAVARQWFGVLIRPRTPADAWLVEGLAGYLHDLFLRHFLGKNELRYRCPSPVDSLGFSNIVVAVGGVKHAGKCSTRMVLNVDCLCEAECALLSSEWAQATSWYDRQSSFASKDDCWLGGHIVCLVATHSLTFWQQQ